MRGSISARTGDLQNTIEVEMPGQMLRQPIERALHLLVIGETAWRAGANGPV